MRAVGNIEGRLADSRYENAGDGGDVGQMSSAAKRIVQDRDIAGLQSKASIAWRTDSGMAPKCTGM